MNSQPSRLPPSSADPVGDALAAAGPVTPRFPDEDLDITELREFIGVGEIDPPEQGFNTVIGLYDEIWSYADTAEDGLEAALADQPGIEAVDAMDREELMVRTSLSLADVHAAAIRALLEINRRPRPAPS